MPVSSAQEQRTLPARWRMSVAELEAMVRAGIFKEDDPVELLDGELYEMAPSGDWHNASVDQVVTDVRIGARGATELILRVQGTLRLSPLSAPEPDITLLRFREDHYRSGGARPEDVLLIVEVSDTTLRHDREVKLPLYAEAGIPEVWVVRREPACIEVYTRPASGAYRELRTYGRGEIVSPEAFPGIRVAVSAVTG